MRRYPTRSSPPPEDADTFQPGGPEELVDRGDLCQAIAGTVERPGVPPERRWIAADIDHGRNPGGRDLGDLHRPASMRRVENHRGEPGKLLGCQRLARQVALGCLDPTGQATMVDGLPQGADCVGVAFE